MSILVTWSLVENVMARAGNIYGLALPAPGEGKVEGWVWFDSATLKLRFRHLFAGSWSFNGKPKAACVVEKTVASGLPFSEEEITTQ